jgi:hypothetical protein
MKHKNIKNSTIRRIWIFYRGPKDEAFAEMIRDLHEILLKILGIIVLVELI